MSVGRGVCRGHGGLRTLDHGAGPPGQHVGERLRHFLPRGVDHLSSGIRQAGDDRFEQLGPALGQCEHGGALGTVTAEEVRLRVGHGDRILGGGVAPRSRSDLVTQRRVLGDSPSWRTTASTVSCAIFR